MRRIAHGSSNAWMPWRGSAVSRRTAACWKPCRRGRLRGRGHADREILDALARVCRSERGALPGWQAGDMQREPADAPRDAARALVDLAATDPIAIPAYELLLRSEWHVGLRVDWVRKLAGAHAFAEDAARITAGLLHKDDALVIAAAETLARLGPRAATAEAALIPITEQRLNRANARAAQRALAAIRGRAGR
jgi:hypothetical protein